MIRPTTFSIVATDVAAGELGVAVQSRFLSVGSVVPWVSAQSGAVATQAWANTTYGPRGLELLRAGRSPEEAIAALVRDDPHADERQVGIVASDGRAATYTGERCMEWAGGTAGEGFAAQGNILAGPAVVEALAETFRTTGGPLVDRQVAAIAAGQRAGGDRRGQQSAALYVAKAGGGYAGFNDRYIDLRVDDHPQPIDELARLLKMHKLYFFPAQAQDVRTIDATLGDEIVELLHETGDLPSIGRYDEAAKAALVRFMHRENLEGRVRADGTIDAQTLEYLRESAASRSS